MTVFAKAVLLRKLYIKKSLLELTTTGKRIMTYNFKCNESPRLTIRWLTTPCNQLNKKEKTEKNACQKHYGADHWQFGSIAQGAMAAVDITFGDFCWPIIQITRGICCRIALRGVHTASTVALDMNSSTFSFYITFSTTVVTGRTGHRELYVVTVFPTI